MSTETEYVFTILCGLVSSFFIFMGATNLHSKVLLGLALSLFLFSSFNIFYICYLLHISPPPPTIIIEVSQEEFSV